MRLVSNSLSTNSVANEPDSIAVWKPLNLGGVDNWLMGKKQINKDVGALAIASGDVPMAVRYLLQLIENQFPGGAVELRVPPFGAIQCVQGLDHRRGTPPNVIEMAPEVFLSLCKGQSTWQSEIEAGRVLASGALAEEAAELFPVELGN